MLVPIYEKRFAKEIQKAQKRGKDMQKLKDIMLMLLNEKILPIKNRNHKLKGNFTNYWECHIEPDWLLIYKTTSTEVIFARTGSHSDLFDK
jgi:mRNA interferase YafQ